jgi:chromosome segregation ATPase
MEKPQTLSAALEALDNATKQIAKLELDLDSAQSLLNESGALQAQVSELSEKNKELLSALNTLKSENSALAEAAKLNEIKLNEAIAAAGVPPVAIQKANSSSLSKEDLWAQWKTLSIYEKNAFWQKHGSAMLS